ncbi:hypothetical protein PHEL85_2877 [Polaribacter sp. Hel1_85]|nr:hypothetical protein PHEL85_2877 [Polaribacter sp. Hel1_85]
MLVSFPFFSVAKLIIVAFLNYFRKAINSFNAMFYINMFSPD